MHMRTKKWAKPELSACPYYRDEPFQLKGKWRSQFPEDKPLYLELGCGKGVSTAKMVSAGRTAILLRWTSPPMFWEMPGET